MSEEPEPVSDEPVSPGPAPSAGRPRRARLASRAGQVTALLCVAAGVSVFAVARMAENSDARVSSTASGPSAVDGRALITDSGRVDSFVAAASTEVVTVSESDYRRLNDSLSAGLSVTTGAFQQRYRNALTGASAQARREHHSATSIDVLQAGIGQISDQGKQAKVLIFARVHQQGDDVDADSADALVTLTLTLVRRGDQFLISELVRGENAGLPPGTSGLKAAAESARSEIINTLTYTRADFAADSARAVDGATGPLRTTLSDGAPSLEAKLTKGGYDLSGSVTSVAVQQAGGDTATLLVAATGSRFPDTGNPSVVDDARYVVSVQRDSGSWLVSSLDPVGR